MVRDFLEIHDPASLDALIDALVAARAQLPADAEVRMRGDDVFGRRLSISWLREQTAEEAALDARYAAAIARAPLDRDLDLAA